MIALSVDNLGEVAGRVTHRRPPAQFDVLKNNCRLNGGINDLVEKDPVHKEWLDVKNLVDAESEEANARAKTECEQACGDTDNAGSSVSAGASAAACSEACQNQEMFLDNLAKEHVRAYVKLRPEPTTIEGVKLAARQRSALTTIGQEWRGE